jgi:hypothetical protein
MSARIILLFLAASVLTGCATGPIGAHQPSLATVQSLRQSNMAPMSVGEFVPAATLKAGRDKSVSVRGSSLKSPSADSFSAYLKDALIQDLRSAGKYDAAAATAISGQLAQNELNAAGVSKADATVAARFVVTRNGTSVFEKLVTAAHEWDSSFMGAIAIPEAINQYTQMYARLLDKLFADEEFKKAVAPAENAATAGQ